MMAKETRHEHIYQAAQYWAGQCLLDDKSIIDDTPIWTLAHLGELDRYYVKSPLIEGSNFMAKLEQQLSPASSAAKRLVAELFWVMFLFPSNSTLRPATKLLKIRMVWEWSGDAFPEDHPQMRVYDRGGIGNTGPGFQNHFWLEVAYFITLLIDLKKKPSAERTLLLGDPWQLTAFMDACDSTGTRQLRHMLVYVLYPDSFECVASGRHKRSMLQSFMGAEEKAKLDFRNRLDIDRALLDQRERLTPTYGLGFNYYLTPDVRAVWLKDDAPDQHSGSTESTDNFKVDSDILPPPYQGKRFWLVAAGSKGQQWDAFRDKNMIAIGFAEFGPELPELDRMAIMDRMMASRDTDSKPTNDSLAVYEFSHSIQMGDYVIAKQGRTRILGLGLVESGYRYDASQPAYPHQRAVRWIKTGDWRLADTEKVATKTLTEFTHYGAWLAQVLRRIGVVPETPGSPSASGSSGLSASQGSGGVGERVPSYGGSRYEAYTKAEALQHAFMDEDAFDEYLDTLQAKKNMILSGPPGTGKTWLARRLAKVIIGSTDPHRLLYVQFHQSYSYDDFVRGWRPGKGGFELVDGPFLRFCAAARQDTANAYVLLIDEINRGDTSRIFGELFSLIESDKRNSDYALRLSVNHPDEEPFYIPDNVYILGTMNSADRSLAVVDYALRRRFAFRTLEPAFERDEFITFMTDIQNVDDELLQRIIQDISALNEAIGDDRNLGYAYRVGHSFFSSIQDDTEPDLAWYRRIIRSEVIPLLEEYWFDEPAKVQEWKTRLTR
jgi:MoxR-like ATPase